MSRLTDQISHAVSNSSAEELYCYIADQERLEKLRRREHLKLVHSVTETEKEAMERKAAEKHSEDSGGHAPMKKVA
jgi:hypothetical protein